MSATFLPRVISHVHAPPLKCQGIKTKLVPFIARAIQWSGSGRWIEPFLGSGVVAFNIAPARARLSDTNEHLIDLYRRIQEGRITEALVRERLSEMGELLRERGGDYYYEVRDRFNTTREALDLLFLNRSCFNGVMRFNGRAKYNVPFGKKPERFRRAYVSKIANQVCRVRQLLQEHEWELKCLDFRDALADVSPDDFVYLDPPYVGRHADYFNQWTKQDAEELADLCHSLPCGYAVSMWQGNEYRQNEHLSECWATDEVRTFTHWYHVGSKESLRHAMTEALVIRPGFALRVEDQRPTPC